MKGVDFSCVELKRHSGAICLVRDLAEVRFVTAVTAAGSVNFFASGVNFSKNTHFFVFLSLKLLKISEIKGVESLA